MTLALTIPGLVATLLSVIILAISPGYAIVFVVATSTIYVLAVGLCGAFRAVLYRRLTKSKLRYRRALAVTGLVWLAAALLAPFANVVFGWLLAQALQAFGGLTYSPGGSFDLRVYWSTFMLALPSIVISLVVSPVLLMLETRRSRCATLARDASGPC
jgi:hypothetical protein